MNSKNTLRQFSELLKKKKYIRETRIGIFFQKKRNWDNKFELVLEGKFISSNLEF